MKKLEEILFPEQTEVDIGELEEIPLSVGYLLQKEASQKTQSLEKLMD